MTPKDWLIISTGVRMIAVLSVGPLFATAFALWLLRPGGVGRVLSITLAWMVAAAVVGFFIFFDVVMAIDSLPPIVKTFPEDYVGLVGSVTTNAVCLTLLFRAQLINNRHAKLRKRGFDVILEHRVQQA